jgi:hypothetical protein
MNRPATDPDIARALEQLSEAGRRWFAARPSRSYRLRKPARRELEMLRGQACTHVLVEQVFPGMRLRRAVRIIGSLPDDDTVLSRLAHEGIVSVGVGGTA